MDTTQLRSPATSARSPYLTLTAWAGVAGPVLFTASFLVQEQFRREEYSPVAEVVSALEAGPNGWIQQVTFLVFGGLTMAHAVGLHHALAPSRAGVLGPALLFVSGVGAVVAGVFPLREDASGVTYDPGGHVVGGMLFFLATPLAFLLLSRRLRRDPVWQALAPYALVAGLALLVAVVATILLVLPDSGPLHDWAGLAQRIIVLVLIFPLRICLGIRQLSVVGTTAHVST